MNQWPNRSSHRLHGHDYAVPGAYFVTLCTQGRATLFGQIDSGFMEPSIAGSMVESWWGELANKFPTILLDAYVVMPNHIHGIIFLGARAEYETVPTLNTGGHIGPPLPNSEDQFEHLLHENTGGHIGPPLPDSEDQFEHHLHEHPKLGDIVRWFKTMSTNDYIRGVKHYDFPRFDGRLWQRDYHDHIVRVDSAIDHIREYIQNNPAQWSQDEENPDHAKTRKFS